MTNSPAFEVIHGASTITTNLSGFGGCDLRGGQGRETGWHLRSGSIDLGRGSLASPHAVLAVLAAYRPVFTRPGFKFGHWTKPAPAGEGVMGYFTMGPEALAWMKGAYEHGWVREFDWGEWQQSTHSSRTICLAQ